LNWEEKKEIKKKKLLIEAYEFSWSFSTVISYTQFLEKTGKKGEKIKKIKKKKGSSVCMPDLLGCHMNIHNHDFNLKG